MITFHDITNFQLSKSQNCSVPRRPAVHTNNNNITITGGEEEVGTGYSLRGVAWAFVNHKSRLSSEIEIQ